jgi:hypothetical protein
LDVWGREARAQDAILRSLIAGTDSDTAIIIKPNPKSKYELTPRLIETIASCSRAYAVDFDAPMGPLFASANLIVTGTGTVAMEAAFQRKPVVVLSQEMQKFVPLARYLPDAQLLGRVVDDVRRAGERTEDETGPLEYLDSIVRSSYPGLISNPYSAPSCLDEENLRSVHRAFTHALGRVSRPPIEAFTL